MRFLVQLYLDTSGQLLTLPSWWLKTWENLPKLPRAIFAKRSDNFENLYGFYTFFSDMYAYLSRSRLTCWAWHHATQNTLRFGSDWIHPFIILLQGDWIPIGVYVSHPWKLTWNTIVKAGWTCSFSNSRFSSSLLIFDGVHCTPSPQRGWTTTHFHLLGRTIRTFIRRAARRRVRCPHRPRPARWHLACLSFFFNFWKKHVEHVKTKNNTWGCLVVLYFFVWCSFSCSNSRNRDLWTKK